MLFALVTTLLPPRARARVHADALASGGVRRERETERESSVSEVLNVYYEVVVIKIDHTPTHPPTHALDDENVMCHLSQALLLATAEISHY